MFTAITVAKFGGTSMATTVALDHARAIVEAFRSHCVVVSAPGRLEGGERKVTDLLIAAHGRDAAAWREVRKRYFHLCQEDEQRHMRAWLNEIERTRNGCTRDWLLSRGEYLMARLMAMRLNRRFVDAADVIRFKKAGDAVVLDHESTLRLIHEHCNGTPSVVPGFYGALADGTIVTFTRGGSDVTAALLAAALGATFQKWTDVDGVYSGDPNGAAAAEHLEQVSYDELLKLSQTLVHPDAVAACREAGVNIEVWSTFAPGGRYTVVTNREQQRATTA